MVVDFNGGVIRFHHSTGNFEATCKNPAHGRCVLTRKGLEASKKKRKVGAGYARGGRPVGLMAAWLAKKDDVPSKKAHMDLAAELDRDARRLARHQLEMEAGGAMLFDFERVSSGDEGTEPEFV